MQFAYTKLKYFTWKIYLYLVIVLTLMLHVPRKSVTMNQQYCRSALPLSCPICIGSFYMNIVQMCQYDQHYRKILRVVNLARVAISN